MEWDGMGWESYKNKINTLVQIQLRLSVFQLSKCAIVIVRAIVYTRGKLGGNDWCSWHQI